MDTIRIWLPLTIAVCLNAAANVLMKIGSRSAAIDQTVTNAQAAPLLGPKLATGLAVTLFVAYLFAYRATLDQMRVSVALPIMVAGNMVLVCLAAVGLLHERITAVQIGGMLLIGLGVWLVSAGGG